MSARKIKSKKNNVIPMRRKGKIENVLLAIPCSFPHVHMPFVISLTQMLLSPNINKAVAEGMNKFQIKYDNTFPLDAARNKICKAAIEEPINADAVIFLDVDQTYPHDFLARIIRSANQPGVDVVGSLYFKKAYPHPPVSGIFKDNQDYQMYEPIEMFDWTKEDAKQFIRPKSDLIPCDIVGMGGTLIKTDVLKNTPYPWFQYGRSIDSGEIAITEDIHFCRQAKGNGFKIFTDPMIECGHIDNIIYDSRTWTQYNQQHPPVSDDYKNYGEEFFAHPTQTRYYEDDECYSSLAEMMKGLVKKDDFIIDVGCGLGKQVKFFQEAGLKALGIDNSPYAIKVCNEQNIPIFKSLAWQIHLTNGNQDPDIIFTSELLEHLNEADINATINSFTYSSARLIFGTINFKNDLPTHKTLQPRAWWDEKFKMSGWIPDRRLGELQKKEKHNRSIICYRRERG